MKINKHRYNIVNRTSNMGKTSNDTNPIYFTITGTSYYYGKKFFEKGMTVLLEKEPDNNYDAEVIMVKVEGLGKVGYVANSSNTVQGESYSAGRLYDKIGEDAIGEVVFVLECGVLAKITDTGLDNYR